MPAGNRRLDLDGYVWCVVIYKRELRAEWITLYLMGGNRTIGPYKCSIKDSVSVDIFKKFLKIYQYGNTAVNLLVCRYLLSIKGNNNINGIKGDSIKVNNIIHFPFGVPYFGAGSVVSVHTITIHVPTDCVHSSLVVPWVDHLTTVFTKNRQNIQIYETTPSRVSSYFVCLKMSQFCINSAKNWWNRPAILKQYLHPTTTTNWTLSRPPNLITTVQYSNHSSSKKVSRSVVKNIKTNVK